MAVLYNLARMTISSGGTGTLTLAGASPGYLTFDAAGVQNGDVVSYGFRDGANSETGTGTYTTATKALTRTVTVSTNSNNAIDASLSAEVYITARSEDILTPTEAAAAYQPLDSDLTSIAALTTTTYGRSLLTLADDDALAAEITDLSLTWTTDQHINATASGADLFLEIDNDATAASSQTFLRTICGTAAQLTVGSRHDQALNYVLAQTGGLEINCNNGASSYVQLICDSNVGLRVGETGTLRFSQYGAGTVTTDGSGNVSVVDLALLYQPLDSDLTSIAALTTTAYGRGLLELADETALEALLDTLPNLTSIQGRTVTLADAGANAIFGWDDTAGAYENLSQSEVHGVIGTLPVANGGTGQTTEAEAVGELIQALTADATPDNAADYIATYDDSADTGKKVLLSTIIRERLTANRTYYVRTDGSDSNTGLANTAGGAKLTFAGAFSDVVSKIDFNGYDVTILMGSGASYTVPCMVDTPWTGGGNLIVDGNGSSVTISTSGVNALDDNCALPGQLTWQNFTVSSNGGSTASGLAHTGTGIVNVGAGMVFGACSLAHMLIWSQGFIRFALDDYEITGDAGYHIRAQGPGSSFWYYPGTVTITGARTFTTFAFCKNTAVIESFDVTFSIGTSVTGARYSATANGVLETFGSGATYYPGDSAGSTATGGQYL
jgi:hypothetical protein